MAVNESEAFVHELCRRTFLSLWSVENPVGRKAGTELADALIVVGADIIVVSVKEKLIKQTGNDEVDTARWYRAAIEGSVNQLRGAGRALASMSEVRRRDNPDVVLQLPEVAERRVHFVAVALGGDDRVGAAPEQHDFGFVHVFDRETVATLMGELDTVVDFVAYLRAKEAFLGRASVVLEGGEYDLLAMYLREGRKFPDGIDMMLVKDGLWRQALKDPTFQRRKQADEVSRAWDNLIEEFAGHLIGGTLLGNAPQDLTQLGLRYMAGENRFHRRMLGGSFVDFLRKAGAGETMSRSTASPSGVVYLFAVCPRDFPSDGRGLLLRDRCAILLEDHPEAQAVVGIIREKPDGDWRHSFGMMVYENPITDEVRGYAAEARQAGALRKQIPTGVHMKEWPDPPKRSGGPNRAARRAKKR
jgi:hypothetical protein